MGGKILSNQEVIFGTLTVEWDFHPLGNNDLFHRIPSYSQGLELILARATMQSGRMTREEIDSLCHTISAGVNDENYLIGFPENYVAWVKR